jgi:iron complex transport system ATP-binding protein
MSIIVSDLSFSYGSHEVLKNVSFKAEAGQLLSVLGPNGVGKSTLFQCMLKLLSGYSGRITVAGTDIRTLEAGAMAKKSPIYRKRTRLCSISPCSTSC